MGFLVGVVIEEEEAGAKVAVVGGVGRMLELGMAVAAVVAFVTASNPGDDNPLTM